MYKHILVPVDLGDAETYRRAINAANTLLEDGGKITLLHAIEPIPTCAESYIPPDFKIESRSALQNQCSCCEVDFEPIVANV
jgi:nucleotide-binding universal stress UspA family protein